MCSCQNKILKIKKYIILMYLYKKNIKNNRNNNTTQPPK